MECAKICLACTAAAVFYGVLHDQVTARVCVEYFTIGHPPVFTTSDPTLLAIGWGTIATWWVGLSLGVLLAFAARCGSWPKRTCGELLKPVGFLMAFVAIATSVAGIAGYVAARAGGVTLPESVSDMVPADKHRAFLADLWAHQAAYATAFVGGGAVCLLTWLGRVRATATRRGPCA